ncbi:PX domain-containing protein EREX isoform X1 [Rhododendron vialii]|uniref:PX domain-containing protein EREX isoform X1 n=1 Tax=Rhododendron vialii TaxID=182163 RepID=UPI00265DD3B9|nr:PX domain-containing protein EREX isoform X1 [Rhododendron vialii]
MDMYGLEPGLYDFGFSDPSIVGSLSGSSPFLSSTARFTTTEDSGDDDDDRPPPPVMPEKKPASPPRHRHDGTSPLPFGMDWSPPPRRWDGRDSIWPHDPHSGWSYCVTIPSWIILPKSGGSDPVVFYRVQIGVQSPDGITNTRGTLRRYSDFLKLFWELEKEFPKKNLPPAPPRSLWKKKSKTRSEERRCSLEDWMQKILSDIDLSRSAPVAIFLELEEAARTSFYDSNQHSLDANSSAGIIVPSHRLQSTTSMASDYANDSDYETSELGTPKHGRDNYSELSLENETKTSDQEKFFWRSKHSSVNNSGLDKDEATHNSSKVAFHPVDEMEPSSEPGNHRQGTHLRRLSTESVGSDVSSIRASELSKQYSLGDNSLDLLEGAEITRNTDIIAESDLQFPKDVLVALPSDQRNKMNRVLTTLRRRLAAAKTDMEDLVARLNQEVAVRQYLTTKVKDLEVDLETTKQSSKENLQQAILIERERYTQTQWDVEELRRKCIDTELELKSERDEKVHMESIRVSIVQENEILQQELDNAREQIENLKKHHDDLELKSKADVKLLVKEVKSLRSYQSELKQELSRLTKEKLEVERVLHKEKERWKHSNAADTKLLHECEILRNRLEECSVNFLTEEEDKLIMDTSSTSDAIDLLTTSDNRIGLLLAEAQLLSQDMENAVTAAIHSSSGGTVRATDDELRKMLTETFIDNARLRKQVNSVLRCALHAPDKSEEDEEEEEIPSRKTVLSKFLER